MLEQLRIYYYLVDMVPMQPLLPSYTTLLSLKLLAELVIMDYGESPVPSRSLNTALPSPLAEKV